MLHIVVLENNILMVWWGGVGEGDSAGEGDGDVSLGKCLELAFYLIAIKVNTKCFVME